MNGVQPFSQGRLTPTRIELVTSGYPMLKLGHIDKKYQTCAITNYATEACATNITILIYVLFFFSDAQNMNWGISLHVRTTRY